MKPSIITSLKERILLQQNHHLRQRLRRLTHPIWLGTLRKTTPVSQNSGWDRGTPIDRYYIQGFLDEHRGDIRGRVFEVKDSSYTDRYGICVERRDVLDIEPTNARATIVADLAAADQIGSDLFDCFVLTQTLQYIYNTQSAVAHARRILRPGGILLVTVPAVSRIVPESGLVTELWRFSVASCLALFSEVFGSDHVTVRSYGNVLAAIALLTGIACEELSRQELDIHDEVFPVVIAIRATKQ